MTTPDESKPTTKKVRTTKKRPARKKTKSAFAKTAETLDQVAKPADKPTTKPRKRITKKRTPDTGVLPRDSATRATQPAGPPPGPDTPRQIEPGPKTATAVTDVSDFGAGILDTEPAPVVAPPAASSRAPSPPQSAGPPPGAATDAQKPAGPADPTIAPPATGGASGSHGERPTRSSRRRRRSRTQRLAEEAAVIAKISGEAPSKPDAGALDKKPSDGAEAAPDAAPPDGVRKTKTRRRSRRKRPTSDAARGHASTPDAALFSDDVVVEDDQFDDLDEAEASPHTTRTRTDDPALARGGSCPTSGAAGRTTALPASAGPIEGDREMLINVAESEECRIAIMSNRRLDELHVERAASSSNVGNIYKGRVTNVEPSIQAAFVDFGLAQHGFLHISDLHPQYFPDSKGETEQVGKKTPRRQRPPIQTCLKRGSEVIVQVIKEGIGTKGPTLSSYISLPGRFLVMMPGMEQLGVSRKIEDEETRRKMRDILGQLSLPKDMGFIVRTAGVDRPKRDLQRDLNFLSRLWKKVDQRIEKVPAPAELYKESDLVIRTIRDVYDTSLKRIVVDNEVVAKRVREFLRIASPRAHDVVEVYTDAEPLFHRFGIEREIDCLYSKTVPLPCGGSLIIEQTEALVAIDVNSGRFRVPENAEETAYRVNLEAVDEIARQLRLRDLGGLIICDLIDMALERHRRQVEKVFADALKKHKERAKILRISRFGLIEMTRQRQRPSLAKSHFRECPKCAGSGRIKAPESVALEIMRAIKLACQRSSVARIDVKVSTPVANDMLNRKRHMLTDLERTGGQTIIIHGSETLAIDQQQISCSDRRGREVQTEPPPREEAAPVHPQQPRSNRRGGRRGRRNRG